MKKGTNKKFWYLMGSGVVILILLMITSSVIQIGERLVNLHPYAPYIFYGLSFILLYFLIIRPTLIIIFSPSFSIDTTLDNNPKREYKVFKRVSKRILEQEDLPEAMRQNLIDSYNDPKKLRDALNNVYNKHIKKKINKVIREHAKTVMVSTAISQNGRLDFITVIVVNIKMIKEIVVLCGFRPSYRNLAKLIVNVFVTALIAEGLENININDVLPTSTMKMLGEIPLIRPIMSSVVEGISNALLTLRIGIVTRKYLFDDASDLTKEKIRFGALVEAAKHLPMVIADGLFLFPKTVMNIFKPKKTQLDQLDEDVNPTK
ncbi:DUF697 domain-containing protein [Acholeplasma granularum]|uniref:DUF697 domain-containing protein n=1 Tax=Acholeplasma granularum TaxID=264635 RepID=UPI0004702E74|nr:DUF697 domain-containing protein [Acholeplasma granularum]